MGISSRLGGLFLAFGAFALLFIIVDYITVMSSLSGAGGPPTDADRAYFGKEHFAHLARGWHLEILAMGFIGAGSLIAMDRVSRAGWALAAMGVVIAAPMYALMIGGYGAVTMPDRIDVPLFMVIRSVASEFFFAGNMILHAGVGLGLGLELSGGMRVLPAWALGLGAGVHGFCALMFGLNHFSVIDNIAIGGMPALLGFLILAIFGVRMASQNA